VLILRSGSSRSNGGVSVMPSRVPLQSLTVRALGVASGTPATTGCPYVARDRKCYCCLPATATGRIDPGGVEKGLVSIVRPFASEHPKFVHPKNDLAHGTLHSLLELTSVKWRSSE